MLWKFSMLLEHNFYSSKYIFILCILHIDNIIHTSHCRLHTAYFKLHTTHTVQWTVDTAYCTLYTANMTLYGLLYTVLCTIHTTHCILYIIQCKLYSVQFTVDTVHCTLHHRTQNFFSLWHRTQNFFSPVPGHKLKSYKPVPSRTLRCTELHCLQPTAQLLSVIYIMAHVVGATWWKFEIKLIYRKKRS